MSRHLNLNMWAVFEPRGSMVHLTIRRTRRGAIREAGAIWDRACWDDAKARARLGDTWPTLSDRPLTDHEHKAWKELTRRGYRAGKVTVQEATP